jgi:hypothetical protein
MAKRNKTVQEENLEQIRKHVKEIIPYGVERVNGFERARRPPGQEGRPRRTPEELLEIFRNVKIEIDVDELRGRTAAHRGRRR